MNWSTLKDFGYRWLTSRATVCKTVVKCFAGGALVLLAEPVWVTVLDLAIGIYWDTSERAGSWREELEDVRPLLQGIGIAMLVFAGFAAWRCIEGQKHRVAWHFEVPEGWMLRDAMQGIAGSFGKRVSGEALKRGEFSVPAWSGAVVGNSLEALLDQLGHLSLGDRWVWRVVENSESNSLEIKEHDEL